ncbi:MAG: hypothetical protein HY558_04035 [Euryarchaeota archaeon]|nr:hypothetical protein [Euryarchaeota archaeon]
MCGLTQRTLAALSDKFEKDPRLERPFQPNQGEEGKVQVAGVNLYPKRGQAQEVFEDVSAHLEERMRQRVLDCGEIQVLEGAHGENVDIGVRQAQILQGKYMEIYCFNCFSVVFLRILLEEGLTKTTQGKQWVSVDVDEIRDSPWFKE